MGAAVRQSTGPGTLGLTVTYSTMGWLWQHFGNSWPKLTKKEENFGRRDAKRKCGRNVDDTFLGSFAVATPTADASAETVCGFILRASRADVVGTWCVLVSLAYV